MVTEAEVKAVPSKCPRWGVAGVAALATVVLGVTGPSLSPDAATAAEPARPGPRDHRCLRELRVRSFTATPATVNFGQSITLAWDVAVPTGCGLADFDIRPNQSVGPRGTLTLTPLASAVMYLHASYPGTGRRTIATTPVTVVLPRDFTIESNNLAPTLRQALGTPGQIIRIRNYVSLDLTAFRAVPVVEGVKVIGERTPQQDGPLLFTRARPEPLLSIRGDRVRISGLRLRGPDLGVSDGSNVRAILADSVRELEVDNNEIFGWRGVGVEIRDNSHRIGAYGDRTIRIHDNFIHHNQNYGRLGYGVSVKDGAYAWIERNVFDYNRHAIEGDGETFTGYHAYDNLVLPNGGRHRRIPLTPRWVHTHQFDMHGQRHCGVFSIFSDSLYNCGRAGHYMDFRYNSFYYARDAAIKVRGTPYRRPCGADVVSNVFRHGSLRDAVQQEETGVCTSNNRLRIDRLESRRRCDVNGDGIVDSFLATGQTWWYSSGGTKHWVFVRRTTERPTTCPPPLPPPPQPPVVGPTVG